MLPRLRKGRDYPGRGGGFGETTPRLFHTVPAQCTRYPTRDAIRLVSRVALNLLLIRLGRFIQFSGCTRIVAGSDIQLFPFAGMFPQLKRLGLVIAGPPWLAKTGVVVAHSRVAHGKIRVKLDGTLIVRQGRGRAFLVAGLSAKAERFQSFERRRGGL